MLEVDRKEELDISGAPAHHLPGLNGLRALAALAVVFSHTTSGLKHFGLNPYVFGVNNDGTPKSTALAGFGVSLFFALSGFLITHLLLLEKKRAQIAVGKFYIRRALRIWPLYYAYLIIAGVGLTLLDPDASRNYRWLPYFVFLLPNVSFVVGALLPGLMHSGLAHYWSLGVEEQYYLLWPWIVKRVSRLRAFCVCAIAFLLLLKSIARFGLGDSSSVYAFLRETRFQCMLIGALGAALFEEQHPRLLRVASHGAVQAAAWITIGLVAINRFHIASFIDNEIISAVTVVLIIGQIVPNRSPFLNLERPLLDFVGQISYGIYVIHPLLILVIARLMHDVLTQHPAIKYPLVYVIVLGATIGMAFLSYTRFERPFLALKERYASIRSSGSMLAILSMDESQAKVKTAEKITTPL